MKVLIAEDDALQRELLLKLISGWGHIVSIAADGSQVLDRTRSIKFDLFVLDVFLPDMSALELIPLIKAKQPDARIFTLTGQSSRELELRLRVLGISYYMAKPFEREELRSIILHLAGSSKLRSGRRTKPVSILSG